MWVWTSTVWTHQGCRRPPLCSQQAPCQACWTCPLPSVGSAPGRPTPLQEPLQGAQRHQRAADQAANGQLPGHLLLALPGEWSAGRHGAVQPRVVPSGSRHACVWMRGSPSPGGTFWKPRDAASGAAFCVLRGTCSKDKSTSFCGLLRQRELLFFEST